MPDILVSFFLPVGALEFGGGAMACRMDSCVELWPRPWLATGALAYGCGFFLDSE